MDKVPFVEDLAVSEFVEDFEGVGADLGVLLICA